MMVHDAFLHAGAPSPPGPGHTFHCIKENPFDIKDASHLSLDPLLTQKPLPHQS